jgi:hypothetical protein
MSSNLNDNEIKMLIKLAIAFVLLILLALILVYVNSLENTTVDSKGNVASFSTPKNKTESETENEENEEVQPLETKKILTNSLVITSLINNKWDRVKANMKDFVMDDDGNCTFEDGYKLYCNNKQVNYIVFDKSYTSALIGGITVGTSFDVIKEKLGEPSFKEDDMIGYKAEQVYVVFYENEAIVYPNTKASNDNLEKLVFSYFNKTYSGNRTNFLVDIRNNYLDFIIEYDENNNIVLISLVRKMKLILDNDGNMEIVLYYEYNAGSTMELYLEENGEGVKQTNEDIIEIFEHERVKK